MGKYLRKARGLGFAPLASKDAAILRISPRKLARLLAVIAMALAVASSAAELVKRFWSYDHLALTAIQDRLDVDKEISIPTWYSSIILFCGSSLLGAIYLVERKEGDRHASRWAALAALFLLLSMDEVAGLHDQLLSPVLAAVLDKYGLLFFPWPWVGVGGALVLGVGLAYRRFLADLPADTRRLFLLAGALYVGGALGLEVVGGYLDSRRGLEDPTYIAIATCEELMEMLGIVIFLYALTVYLGARTGRITITVGDGAQASDRGLRGA